VHTFIPKLYKKRFKTYANHSMLIAGVPKTKIAKRYGTTVQNLYSWLEKDSN